MIASLRCEIPKVQLAVGSVGTWRYVLPAEYSYQLY